MKNKFSLKSLLFILIFCFLLVAYLYFFNTFNIFNKKIKDAPISSLLNSNATPKFEDYKVLDIFKGQSAEVNVNSSSSTRMFRTALRDAANNGTNFAGKYIVATWGCGSSCQDHMIIDAISGKVYDPFPEATVRGIDYKIDSNLIIFDPVDETDFWYPEMPPKYFLWKDNQLIKLADDN